MILDWAWPARGAVWIDPACLALWLIHAGHTPGQAETWIRGLPSCTGLTEAGLDAFVAGNASLWTQISTDDPDPWKQAMAATAWCWRRRCSNR